MDEEEFGEDVLLKGEKMISGFIRSFSLIKSLFAAFASTKIKVLSLPIKLTFGFKLFNTKNKIFTINNN